MAPFYDTTERDELRTILDKRKGQIGKEFEKICPTDASFHRMIKELHNIFDGIYEDIKPLVK